MVHDHTFYCGQMIAHYLFFLSLVNQFTFFCIACIFAKLTKIESDWGEHEQHPPLVKFRHFMFPIMCWLFMKSNHHYTLNISIQSIVTMISPITYFYTIAKPGKVLHLICHALFVSLVTWNVECVFLFSRHLRHSIHSPMAKNIGDFQWHYSICKYYMVFIGFGARRSGFDRYYYWFRLNGPHRGRLGQNLHKRVC